MTYVVDEVVPNNNKSHFWLTKTRRSCVTSFLYLLLRLRKRPSPRCRRFASTFSVADRLFTGTAAVGFCDSSFSWWCWWWWWWCE